MYQKLLFIMLFLFCMVNHLLAVNTGKIAGRVTDTETGSNLPAANVLIEGTSIGTATDLNGRFIIPGVQPGTYQLTISYVGYKKKTMSVTVPDGNKIVEIKCELEHETISGETVVITAQAEGQQAAINQQLRSNNIKNVISAERIQEIPEVSAAEAVGRLPGISLKDDKMVIRGLSPHYNQIQIDGFDMASTDDTTRSSGLGMISQYMLGGIEVTKSAMADNEANVIGATVNLILKEAPDEPTLNVLLENGYNDVSDSYENPKIIINGSKRFYNNLIGVFGQLTYENGHTGTDEMTAVYAEYFDDDAGKNKTVVDRMDLLDVNDHMKYRLGASLLTDYTTNTTKIKFSNFFSSRESEKLTRSATFDDGISHNLEFNKENITILNNSLKIEQYIGDYKLSGSVAYAYAKNESPLGVSTGMWDNNGIMDDAAYFDAPPIEIPKLGTVDFHLEESSIGEIREKTHNSENSQLSFNFDIERQFEITNWMGLNIQMGAMYKHQSKEYDYNEGFISFNQEQDWRGLMQALAAADIPWLPNTVAEFRAEPSHNPSPFFAGTLVVDPDYEEDDLLLGDYDLKEMPDKDRVLYLLDFAKSKNYYFQQNSLSYQTDYHGTEDYTGAYIMPQIDLLGKLTLNLGIRYERNETDYTAWRLPLVAFESPTTPWTEIANYYVDRKRKNEFLLPMLHAIYRPFDWFSVKASYTHTLSRPKFQDFIPRWRINQNTIVYNDPYLKPALAENIDLYLSFHEAKLGLFTIGGFHKNIKDLVFKHGEIPLSQVGSAAELTEMFDGLPGNEAVNKRMNWTMNSSEAAYVNGIELEWQTSFWYLPGLLKGLVLNVNFTKQSSEAKYPRVDKSEIITGYDTTYIFGQIRITPKTETVYADTFYTRRMIDQANEIFNIAIGYDYMGFSIRASMKFTDDLFQRAEYHEVYNENTKERYNYDIAIRQVLPLDGLNAYCNITNIGRSRYIQINNGSGNSTIERYGGIGLAFGLRYKL
ncbi:MAG: TonB-dependent receptor [Ignavibacteria bacterium]